MKNVIGWGVLRTHKLSVKGRRGGKSLGTVDTENRLDSHAESNTESTRCKYIAAANRQ